MEKQIEQIAQKIIERSPETKLDFDNAKRKVCGALKTKQPSNRELLKAYQNLVKKKSIEPDKNFLILMRKADIRTLSGIAVITSLTKPYACPGQCVYCPTEARMPKSYLASEPAAARALSLKFDPYFMMQRRIKMLESNGHPCDKIEYIIKGGTWNAYPLKYQYWFVLESFKACNDLTRRQKSKSHQHINTSTLGKLQELLEIEQEYNDKKAKYKIIGLTLETRPDAVSEKTILHMRRQGCTRIELGLQAPDDRILNLVKRGHTVQQCKDAMILLRSAGFKVDLHFMPDLPGTTPKHDVEMYKFLFTDPGFKPDMVKIYPNTVIKSAELHEWLEDGRYTPYGNKELFDALMKMKLATPRYCRISRLIRDIPTDEISAGNQITNLREALAAELEKQGKQCVCLRCREVGHTKTHKPINPSIPYLFVDEYKTSGGTEYFLSFEDEGRNAVFGFLRLRLPSIQSSIINLQSLAFIRELHTYGQLVGIGKQDKSASQHKGLGKRLVTEAENIARKNSFEKIAVISGVGVRGYYRKLGYRKKGTYMVKTV
ncbi:MAG: tRNA uridine(34) 5-carboxymethylaminomethyl modification radical SAM/GNAT enzyme Elp3 [Candidatus Magasanikbacteria bacterium]